MNGEFNGTVYETDEEWHDRVIIDLGSAILMLTDAHADDNSMDEKGLIEALHATGRMFSLWEFYAVIDSCEMTYQLEFDENGVYRCLL
jgi:hypothetical protein